MNCPNCQHQNSTTAKFCEECGNRLHRLCPQCQHRNKPTAKFCEECGNNLSEGVISNTPVNLNSPTQSDGVTGSYPVTPKAAERRQLTCLFCDLVGSTALSEQLDAEDFRQVILDYQQIAEEVINQHGGHVAQYLGDGLLVYFGYPQGLENAPKAGVQAGLEILEAVAKANKKWVAASKTEIEIRIGIHTGLVVVDDHLALGDTVNIAARLEGLAPINGLVISPQTLKLVQGWFAVKSLGKEVLKGIKEPMEIFQVIKESGASSRIEIAIGRGLSPLVGREEEVYMLLRNWKKAKEGKGQLLVLNGEAGIGKSRLVESIKGQVKQEQKAAKLELRCSDYHVNSPFYPLIDLLEKRILRFEKDEIAESKIAKLEVWMDFANLDKKPHLPIYADFLSIPISEELRKKYENALLINSGKRTKFMEGFSTALFNFALQQPLLLIVEDLHWMDSSTLEWLTQLLEQINAYPLFVLATTRPQFQPPWSNKSYIGQVNLHRLNMDRIESICYHQTQGKSLPKAILEQIKTKTDGVPLFVEELTRMIIESDLLVEKEAHYELNPAYEKGFDLAVPSTLQDSLIARLDNLSSSRAIAQIGAVLGREFSFELLQAVAQKEATALQKDLAQLVAAELLYQKGYGNQATYIFKHALIQDTAYETLLRSKRQQLHQQVVTVLEHQFPELVETQPELLAHHLTEAGLKQKALLMWEKAGNKTFEQNNLLAALHHFQKAFSLLDAIEETSERMEKELALLLPYNNVLMLVKGWSYPEVEKNGLRIIELCQTQNNLTLSCIGYYGLTATSEANGRFDGALNYAQKGLAIAEQNEAMDFRPAFHGIQGEINCHLGNWKESEKHLRIAIQQYHPKKHKFLETLGSGDIWWYANGFLSVNLLAQGYIDKVKAIKKQMVERVKGETFFLNLHRLQIPEEMLHKYCYKDWQKTYEVYASFLAIVEEVGENVFVPAYQTWVAIVSFALNGKMKDYTTALTMIRELRSAGSMFYQTLLLGGLAEACHHQHKVKEGLACLEEAFQISTQTKEASFSAINYKYQGDLLLLNNQPTEAEQAYQQAIFIAQQQSAKWFELLAAKELAGLWQSQGKTAEAYEVLYGVYSWFTEGFDTKDIVEAKELLEELQGGMT